MNSSDVRALALARWRMALILGAVVFVLYFGFIFAAAFARELMATEIIPGLSLGIIFGALVIVGAWLTTWFYVTWANTHVDSKLSSVNNRRDPD